MSDENTIWATLLPADGVVEFPTMGQYTLRIRSRYDGHYECDVMDVDYKIVTGWMLTPDENIAICLRKTPEQMERDEAKFVDKFVKIIGIA